jgi:hypothetical protein
MFRCLMRASKKHYSQTWTILAHYPINVNTCKGIVTTEKCA